MNAGIYEIRNTVNGKCYIGSAKNFARRWMTHRSQLRADRHHCRGLANAWAKHGEAAFQFRPILLCGERDLILYEQIALNALRPEYNSTLVAGKNHFGGRKHAPETIAKMSAAKIGNTATKGKPRSRAAVEATASAHRGMKRSEETRRRLSRAMTGKKVAPEVVEARSAKLRGRKLSPERRAKLVGNKHAAGVACSDERKAHLAAVLRRRWAECKASGQPWKKKRRSASDDAEQGPLK